MSNKVDERVQYSKTIKEDERKKEKRILEAAQEALQDFDSCFMLKKPSCDELLGGNTIICQEMDLFELYICVVVKELKRGLNIGSVVWGTVDISGKTVVYPYIEEIWNVIVKEYGEKTCSKINTNSVFSRRVKRCGVEPQDKIENMGIVAELIFCINREEIRENKYDDLIALSCIYFKELYDIVDECIFEKGLFSGVQATIKQMLNDYYNNEIKSEVVKKIYDITMKRQKKNLEKLLYNRENSHIDENNMSNTFFWHRVTVCSKWDDYYYMQSEGRP